MSVSVNLVSLHTLREGEGEIASLTSVVKTSMYVQCTYVHENAERVHFGNMLSPGIIDKNTKYIHIICYCFHIYMQIKHY